MTGSVAGPNSVRDTDRAAAIRSDRLVIPSIASGAAAILHATAAGVHADQTALARTFVLFATLQGAVAVAGFTRARRSTATALAIVNLAAAVGWLITRVVGLSWFPGLEIAERPQLADSVAAILALVAVVGAISTRSLADRSTSSVLPPRAMVNASILAGVLLVPALADATSHSHAGAHGASAVDDHVHGADDPDGSTAGSPPNTFTQVQASVHPDDVGADPTSDHDHDEDAPSTSTVPAISTTSDPANATPDHGGHVDHPADHAVDVVPDPPPVTAAWPRPWDPSAPIDFAGVVGVTAQQQANAEDLARDTILKLPAFADVNDLEALGYRSIGDASTGHEHYINISLIGDDRILDPTAPESLVFRVDGDERTLVSAMFIVADTPIDDPSITDFAGPLMQWHVHENLCWGLDPDGEPVVKSVLANPGDACPEGTVNTGGEHPMVHVWIAPHECGPFAALEGVGSGQVADGQEPWCDSGHGGH